MQFGVALSPDERYAAAAGFDGVARMWDIASGQEVKRFMGHSQGLYAIDFSPDGKWIATSSFDGTLQLWHTDLEDLKTAMCNAFPRDLTAEDRGNNGITGDDPTCSEFGK